MYYYLCTFIIGCTLYVQFLLFISVDNKLVKLTCVCHAKECVASIRGISDIERQADGVFCQSWKVWFVQPVSSLRWASIHCIEHRFCSQLSS